MPSTTILPHPVRKSIAAAVRGPWAASTIQDWARRVARRELGVERLTPAQAREADALADRIVARRPEAPARTLAQRLSDYVARVYRREVVRRGGETTIATERGEIALTVAARAKGLTLLRAEGWRYYSRRFGSRPAALAYLCGRDDNGPWAVRVPGTCTTIGAALNFIEPTPVRRAREAGKRVLRQGDVYAVEARQDRALTDARGLPERHAWDATSRTLLHLDTSRPHAPLTVPFPARLYAQRAYAMGRTAARGSAD